MECRKRVNFRAKNYRQVMWMGVGDIIIEGAKQVILPESGRGLLNWPKGAGVEFKKGGEPGKEEEDLTLPRRKETFFPIQ